MYPIDFKIAWEHIQFIADEAIRFVQMTHAELMKHEPKSDMLYTLPQTAGRNGATIIGDKANSRVLDLCELYLAKNDNRDSYDLDMVVREMKKVIIGQILLAGRDIQDEDLSTLFEELAATLDGKRVGLTHHIPCVTVNETTPSEFRIGPVNFMLTSRFLVEKEEPIAEWEKSHVERTNAARSKTGMELIKTLSEGGEVSPSLRANNDFFTGFPWTASVWIHPSHPDVSRERATQTVQATIDLLSVATGGDRGRRMRVAYGAVEPGLKAWLSETSEGKLLFSHSTSMRGVLMGDGWHDFLLQNWKWFFVIGGNLLHSLTSDQLPAPIWRRFIDALRWYGEAIRDNDLPSKIAKYSACMERLVITGNNSGVAKKLPNRLSLLLKRENPDFPQDELRSDIEKFYELRCEIMHGDDLPSRKRLQWGASYGDYLCAEGLICSLDLFHGLTTKNKKTDANLGEAYDRLGKNKSI